MKTIGKIILVSIISYLAGVLRPINVFAQQNSNASTTTELRDGQHDFDYNIGKWKTHITRLEHPLSGTTKWIKMEGTVTTTKLWDGRAQIEQIEADGPSGHWEGMTLFLYNPQSHQWSQTFAGSASGVLEPPIIGEFKNGRGEFFGPDTFNGRSIITRGIWSDITPNTHKFEQAFSEDGGKTWETNFIATLERIE
jgi:hypothetical protein